MLKMEISRIVEILYQLLSLPIIAYGLGLALVFLVGVAVGLGVVETPFIHAR